MARPSRRGDVLTLPRNQTPVLDLRVSHDRPIATGQRDSFNQPVARIISRETWAGMRPLSAGDDIQTVGDSQIPVRDFDLYVRNDGQWGTGDNVTIRGANYNVRGVSAHPRARYAVVRIRQIGG